MQQTISVPKVSSARRKPNVSKNMLTLEILLRNTVVKKKNANPSKPGSCKKVKAGTRTIRGSRNACLDLMAPVTSASQALFDKLKDIPDRLKQNANITAVIRFSNATPFKDKKNDGYECMFCRNNCFVDPASLRRHYRTDHESDRQAYVARTQDDIKVDITGLQCDICSHKVDDVPTLKKHLASVHNKRVFEDVGDKILPFKLSRDGLLYCTVCGQPFEAYKTLHEHMNMHYRNFVCDICDAGFVTLSRLKYHVGRHVDGKCACKLCGKTFRSTEKLSSHVKGVHMGLWAKHKCPQCQEYFTSYDKRQSHLVDVHNASPIVYECRACDRQFQSKRKLTAHTNNVHLLRKDHACAYCEMSFFKKTSLDYHMLKHTKVRAFQCKVCRKSYGRKSTLREHMRIHNNDRRFACGECGVTFVQKCSVKSHISSHHPDVQLDKGIMYIGKS